MINTVTERTFAENFPMRKINIEDSMSTRKIEDLPQRLRGILFILFLKFHDINYCTSLYFFIPMCLDSSRAILEEEFQEGSPKVRIGSSKNRQLACW